MFTPRSIVKILEKIHSELPEENVFGIFPSGGVSGTIKNWYAGENGPYVFAKTGTLSGKHCLSGYLKTKKGKTLIFSFMHNNFKGSSAPLKREMEKVLKRIYEEY
jgi:D-alanyl-D-alanine carboxypeptidase/D-alanyl-D-alanine-endopeptidase (penicillin-binding protein 4)